MNPRILLFAVFALAVMSTATVAQTSSDPNEGSQLNQDSATGAYSFSWWGVGGRTYFLQQSDDLINWTYLPVIESGVDDVIQWGFTSSAAQSFMRLEPTDIPTGDPFDDDFNVDGLSNWQNLQQGSDPLGVALMDTNGLSMNWEQFYNVPTGTDPNALAPRGDGTTYLQAFEQGLNPNDYYNGQPPSLTVISVNPQTGPPGGFAPQPLVVQVTDANGSPLVNAPITFQADAGQLQASNNATPSSVLSLLTDANGQAQAFFELPNSQHTTCTVTASATTNGQSVQVTFSITSDDGTGTFVSPFAPTNFVSQGNPDGSLDMTWTNNTDDQTPVEIEIQQADGSWRLVATLPPGTTSYHYSPGQ